MVPSSTKPLLCSHVQFLDSCAWGWKDPLRDRQPHVLLTLGKSVLEPDSGKSIRDSLDSMLSVTVRHPKTQVSVLLMESAARLVHREEEPDLGSALQDLGTVYVCPHCLRSQGLSQGDLHEGVRLASDRELAELLVSCTEVVPLA